MSYILDALKKSEQERGHGHIPSVQTVHTSSLNYHNKKAIWPYILISAVLLNLAAIIYFYLDDDTATVADAVASKQENITTDGTSSLDATTINTAIPDEDMTDITQEDAYQNAAVPPEAFAVKSTENASSTATTTSKSSRLDITSVVEFHDLPESIKNQLPNFTISAHVYSSNPLQRSIVINNNFLEEGEYVLDDLILQEITQDGAIMFYQGRSFHYNVISGWQ